MEGFAEGRCCNYSSLDSFSTKLLFFSPSSWYLPDYNFGGHLAWGYKAGCAFVNDSCAGWMDWTNKQKIQTDPFCDGLDYRKGREGCVDGRTAAGPCFARNYSTALPLEYQVSWCVCVCMCVCVCVCALEREHTCSV